MKSHRHRRAQVLSALMAVTILAAAVGTGVASARSASRVDMWIGERAFFVESAVNDAIVAVVADLEAVAAYVEASDPGFEEFVEFVDQVSGTYASVGVAYAAVVPADEVAAHVAAVQQSINPAYEISRMDTSGELEPISADGRSFVYPVLRFAPGETIKPLLQDLPIEQHGIGLDGGYNPAWRDDVHAAVVANGPAVSEFLTLEFEDIPVPRIFFASVPVHDSTGTVVGIVAAPMIESLLLAGISRRSLDGVEWEVLPVDETPTRVTAPDSREFPLEMPGATWKLALAPSDDTRRQLLGTPPWVFGLSAAFVSALCAMTLVLSIGRRSEQRRANELRRIADDKDRFLATVSHELRTPLTAVTGLAHELLDRPQDFAEEDRSALLELLVEQSDELGAIVEDLLIAARSDIGKVVIHREVVDLVAEARRAMETAAISAALDDQVVLAWADAQRVRQILRNLLSNARRYGGPEVRVLFSADAASVNVVIADDGPPIPETERMRIFNSYTTAHSPQRGIESVGLGLFISRNLALAMGGDLRYTHDGAWSRFELTLLRAQPDHAGPIEQQPVHASSGRRW